jgi:two-component system response regulator HydG
MDQSVLLVDDDPAILKSVGSFLERSGYEVFRAATGELALAQNEKNAPDVVLLDLHLPEMSGFEVLETLREQGAAVIVLTGRSDIETAVQAMQRGAENFLTKPVDMPHLLLAVDRVRDKVRMRRDVGLLMERANPETDTASLGSSPKMREIARQVELLATNDDTTTLIIGESGTGKGHLARMIHSLSARSREPFVDINCGSLNAMHLDSELFGAERGADPDASDRRPGLFELADRGTILLDAIGELAPELQPKLLRVLESKAFRRMGGAREISVDVRVIAATSTDLAEAVWAGRFRDDLFYRLNVLPILLPPCRERTQEDRLGLLERLLASLWRGDVGAQPTIETAALERLLAYPWPGNVREMRNVLERALLLAQGQASIGLEHLPPEIRRDMHLSDTKYDVLTLREVERRQIGVALQHHNGNRTHTARDLAISRATLIKKIKLYELDA